MRVTYSSLGNNAYEGASELILGTHGTLYLTSSKGLLFQERTARTAVPKAGATGRGGVTAGKTLKLSNDPWAFRGKPIEIDIAEGNDTRDELVSFLDHVAAARSPHDCRRPRGPGRLRHRADRQPVGRDGRLGRFPRN